MISIGQRAASEGWLKFARPISRRRGVLRLADVDKQRCANTKFRQSVFTAKLGAPRGRPALECVIMCNCPKFGPGRGKGRPRNSGLAFRLSTVLSCQNNSVESALCGFFSCVLSLSLFLWLIIYFNFFRRWIGLLWAPFSLFAICVNSIDSLRFSFLFFCYYVVKRDTGELLFCECHEQKLLNVFRQLKAFQ